MQRVHKKKYLFNNSDDQFLLHNNINMYVRNTVLSYNNVQLDKFIKMYKTIPEKDKPNYYTQSYICALILYPELGSVIDLFDEHIVKKYNDIIIKEDTLLETKILRIKFGKIVCYNYDMLNYYINASKSQQSEYLEIADILIDYIPLCYESCCGRTEGSLMKYFRLLMNISHDKRRVIATYIKNAGYSSLYIAKKMSKIFSKLTLEEMKIKFTRAKRIWPDCHIHKTHRFEFLFIKLLKMDDMPSENDIVKIAKRDKASRQDISLCFWNDKSEKINKVTRLRLGLNKNDEFKKYYASYDKNGNAIYDENGNAIYHDNNNNCVVLPVYIEEIDSDYTNSRDDDDNDDDGDYNYEDYMNYNLICDDESNSDNESNSDDYDHNDESNNYDYCYDNDSYCYDKYDIFLQPKIKKKQKI